MMNTPWKRAAALALALGLALLAPARAQDAPALKARYDSLKEKLANNPFQRPLVL
jgi:hypothetical protein